MKNRSKQITAVGNSLLARLAGILLVTLVLASVASQPLPAAPADPAHNPLIWADVPDIAMIRVGKTYYMSSTTMHMSPGLPIMKSEDLVNWRMASYAYETLADNEALRLENGKDAYSKGSWAGSVRFHDGVFYATTFSYTSGRTHIYSTRDPERGPWKETSFEPAMHDNSLFFDDDGRVYMVYGGGRITLIELKPDLSGIKPGGVNKVLIENVNTVFGADQGGLNGEGSHLSKINGRYYLVNIASPGSRWARSVIVNRADAITGPYEARIVLDDRGIAQGGLIDTPEGKWYAYLFKDNAAVGRIPYLVPVTWKDGWPVLGENGKAPMTLDIPASGQGVSGASGIVASDEFDRQPGAPALPLAWQWNHNPDNKLWSVTQRPGFLRLTTGRVDADLLSARNTLTQRTFGPRSSATTSIDVSGMKDGDYAGLAAFQKRYGFVGVKMSGGARSLVMVSADSDHPEEIASVPLSGKTVHLKVECEFQPAPEVARFSYSLDGQSWTPIGRPSGLRYTVPHFMGYRFALFYYSTKTAGGRVDFDYYRIGKAATHSDLRLSFSCFTSQPAFVGSSVPASAKNSAVIFRKLSIINLGLPLLMPPSSHITSPKLLVFVLRSVGSICPRVPSALTVKVPPQAFLRQFVSISDDTCFKTHSPWLLAFRQSNYALLTARQQPGNPRNTISNNSGPLGNYSCRQWGIVIVVDGLGLFATNQGRKF